MYKKYKIKNISLAAILSSLFIVISPINIYAYSTAPMKLGEATADNVFSKVESALGTTGTNILQFSTILAVIIVAWTALWQGLITKDKDFGKNIRRIIVAYIVIVSIGLISSTLAKTLFGSNTLSFAKPAIG